MHNLLFSTRMSEAGSQNTDLVSNYFSELLSQRADEDVVVAHCGVFEADDVNAIAFALEKSLREAGVKKGIVKRLFSILIEALQNIRLHGERSPDGRREAYVIVTREENGFLVRTANLVITKNIEKVKARLDYLNDLTEDELKAYYVEVLTNGQISVKGGAGLGFITIAMKSKSRLDYDFVEFDSSAEGLQLFCMETMVS